MPDVDIADVHRLSAETGLDPRTIRKAIDNGIDSLRGEVDRNRLRAAAKKLKIRLS